MKLIPLLFSVAAPALLTGLLAGCATNNEAQHKGHHADAPVSQAPGAMKDMQAMCDMHRQIMSAKTPAERQAMMDDHMKTMSPEMRKHMQMMQEQCK